LSANALHPDYKLNVLSQSNDIGEGSGMIALMAKDGEKLFGTLKDADDDGASSQLISDDVTGPICYTCRVLASRKPARFRQHGIQGSDGPGTSGLVPTL
jgi:hypothetical protein